MMFQYFNISTETDCFTMARNLRLRYNKVNFLDHISYVGVQPAIWSISKKLINLQFYTQFLFKYHKKCKKRYTMYQLAPYDKTFSLSYDTFQLPDDFIFCIASFQYF